MRRCRSCGASRRRSGDFKTAMEDAHADESRRAFPAIQVDPIRVQDSGLVKEVVNLDIPDEAGNFDTVLVRRAAKAPCDSSARWERYAQSEGAADVVKPLLVLQVPNTPDHDQIGLALDEILRVMPELSGDSVRHVFGDHTVQKFGSWEVDWIEPQRVESKTSVRVLVAKDAISTGWDCPRAEVMVSFRPAKDQTHITQLLGRMVRNPLARPVPGDERLNSVDCILPFFDRTTAGNVAKFLSGAIGELPGGDGKKVLLDGTGTAEERAASRTSCGPHGTLCRPRRCRSAGRVRSSDSSRSRKHCRRTASAPAPSPRSRPPWRQSSTRWPSATRPSSRRDGGDLGRPRHDDLGSAKDRQADLHRVRRARRRPCDPRRIRGREEGVRRRRRPGVRQPPRRRRRRRGRRPARGVRAGVRPRDREVRPREGRPRGGRARGEVVRRAPRRDQGAHRTSVSRRSRTSARKRPSRSAAS